MRPNFQFLFPNPNKPEPNKIYFYHENTKVRKHEKENLISHFLFFRGFVIVFNSFANFARILQLRDLSSYFTYTLSHELKQLEIPVYSCSVLLRAF